MKRFITLIVAACAFFAVVAQYPMVTLSHNGELSFFKDLSAFEDAISAATDGDIIYLSEGIFTTKADTVKINKRLSIQGCGYKSRITSHLLMDMRDVTSDELDLPLFDGVRIRTIQFVDDSVSTNKTKNASITKCYIENAIWPALAAKNMLIDRCWIESFNVGTNLSGSITLKNSKIEVMEWYTSNGMYYDYGVQHTTVINCNIKLLKFLPKVTISSILGRSDLIARNSPTLYNTLTWNSLPSGAKADGCYTNTDFTINDKCEVDEGILNLNNWLGQDGKVVGVYGGDFPFTENPSVPTVDSANSSAEYDAESNTLNVTITVLPN